MSNIIQVNEEKIKGELGELVRKTVEEMLNEMLDAEADEITQAHKYERTESRTDTRAGHYHRKLVTKAGEVDLKIPKLRKLPFETAIIERYKRREESVEEALIEMYLAGVSVRRVEDISEALWLMYLDDCWLKANVVVEHTQGRPCLAAVSLPQKHAESVTTTSGRQDATSSDTTGSRFATVRNDCTLISVVDTSWSLRSLFASRAGK